MKLIKLVSIGLSSLFLCSTVIAEDGDQKKKKGKKPKRTFVEVDTDKDGKIGEAEFTAGAKDEAKAKARFGKKDKDNDGFLSKEEFGGKPKGKKGPKKAPKKPKKDDA